MRNETFIASRTLLAVDADGREFELTIAIGQPYEISSDEWACPVSTSGLHERLHDAPGVDSWQAMQLAYQLVAQLLQHFVEGGGKLFWPGDREPVTLVELIPHVVKQP